MITAERRAIFWPAVAQTISIRLDQLASGIFATFHQRCKLHSTNLALLGRSRYRCSDETAHLLLDRLTFLPPIPEGLIKHQITPKPVPKESPYRCRCIWS